LSFTSYPLRGIWDCPTGPDNTGTKVLLFQVNHGQNPRMGFELRKKRRYEGAEKFTKRMKNV